MFDYLLYTSLIIFLLGSIYKASNWFTKNIGFVDPAFTITQRLKAAGGGIRRVIFSTKILVVLKAIVIDVLLQGRVFKEGIVRWLAHMLIFYGFMLLLLMHAMDSVITEAWFDDYYATVNPFFFLRDFCGAMVLTGVALAVFRRYLSKTPRLRTGVRDHYAIIILAVIMLSGIGLIGLKISSHSEFMLMVQDYAGLDDEEEIQALEAVWVKDYGLVSPNVQGPFDEDLLAAGQEVNEGSCLECHASAQWAFTGYILAKIIKPVAVRLDQVNGITILWYIHIIACFAGLAYLPFSKMFHIICTPISLIANRVMDPRHSAPANILTRQVMELDACTHCGSCSLNCSAGMIYEAVGNRFILPSEKMAYLKKMVCGKKLDNEQLHAIAEGVYLCTNCDRCTVHCPSGIRLKELWFSVREALLQKGPPLTPVLTPFSFARGAVVKEYLRTDEYILPIEKAAEKVAGPSAEFIKSEAVIPLNVKPDEPRQFKPGGNTFSHCFSCQSCSAVCPVVGNYEDPEQVLGLLPHQIMCSLGLDLSDMASGAKMVWDCLTCYQCQENCPQQVEVCDLLYKLKNVAVQKAGIG
ncbi:Heterodisulfide reductase subunit C-like protein [Olavius sp. associated proteobacterium Delta 1]|nr:Heterodisulfide reductase subunit C-like protein [Olavius sp. associated proteobacterium Delta 1]